MTRLKRKLVETENDRTNGRLSPLNMDVLVQSKSQHQHCNYKDLILNTIIDSVKQSNYLSAIEYQKITQQTWPNEFGRLNENDFDTILLVVCLQKRNEYPSELLFAGFCLPVDFSFNLLVFVVFLQTLLQ
jgi:hypothetical protein